MTGTQRADCFNYHQTQAFPTVILGAQGLKQNCYFVSKSFRNLLTKLNILCWLQDDFLGQDKQARATVLANSLLPYILMF